jgi:hypothetical protein
MRTHVRFTHPRGRASEKSTLLVLVRFAVLKNTLLVLVRFAVLIIDDDSEKTGRSTNGTGYEY